MSFNFRNEASATLEQHRDVLGRRSYEHFEVKKRSRMIMRLHIVRRLRESLSRAKSKRACRRHPVALPKERIIIGVVKNKLISFGNPSQRPP